LWESDNIFYKRILAFSAILYATNTALTIHDDMKICNIIVLSNLMGYGGLVAILCQKFWSNICYVSTLKDLNVKILKEVTMIQ
jgi:hypothetical protein